MLDQDEAVRHLVELGYEDPADAAAREAQLRRRASNSLRNAIELHKAGQSEEAVANLVQLAAEDEAWAAPHRQLAAIHYGAGRFDDAQVELNWLTYHGVEHARLALLSGGIALMRRRLGEAREYFEYAAFVDPTLPGVHSLLGVTLLRLNQIAAAEQAFERAIEKNPADVRALDGLASVCLRNGDYEEAAEYALNALEHDMQFFRAHYHLGIALQCMGRPAEAITAFETVVRLDTNRSAPFHWLSRIAADELRDEIRSAAYREQGKRAIRIRRQNRAAREANRLNAKSTQ